MRPKDDLASGAARRPPRGHRHAGSPPSLRHAFADRVTRLAGLRHASIQTTEGYLTKPSPDELVEAMARVTLAAHGRLPDRPR
jgi:hypothetical protein